MPPRSRRRSGSPPPNGPARSPCAPRAARRSGRGRSCSSASTPSPAGLHRLGVRRGDSVALLLSNRPEFHLADMAAATARRDAVLDLQHVLARADRVRGHGRRRPGAHRRGGAARGRARGAQGAAGPRARDRRRRRGARGRPDPGRGDGRPRRGVRPAGGCAAVEADDVVTLIYTSGTTGPPKGVQLTHRNVMSAVAIVNDLIRLPEDGRVISWLPAAHVAERVAHHYLPIAYGLQVTCCHDPRQILAYLPEVRPSWFFAVPRIWEKLKPGLETMFAGLPDEQRAGAQAGLAAALEKVAPRAARRAGARRAGRPRGRRRPGGLRPAARAARVRRVRVGERRRGAHARRGPRVLPRHRDPGRRAVGHVRDDRRGLRQPARAHQDRQRRTAVAGRRGQARRGRRAARPRRRRHARLPQPPRPHGGGHRRRRVAAHGRHRRDRRRTATSASSTARRS